MQKLRTDTMYPLKEVFTNFLEHAEAEREGFIIPAYQRGYKWTSTGENSQIKVLMRDLYDAFKNGKARYYLQFITMIKSEDGLEVIDGQQRLTTLTILFSVLSTFEQTAEKASFVSNKLKYQVRDNFIKQFIYENIEDLLEPAHWDEFLKIHEEAKAVIDNQDVYFIYHAAKAINDFLINAVSDNELSEFYQYLCNEVYLIINLLQPGMHSEEIFINVNKGVKLQDQDLVKALLITKIPLESQQQAYRYTENEINSIRANVGRQWDQLAHWSAKPEIKGFFRQTHSEIADLSWLINLTYPDLKTSDEDHPLFSHFNGLIKRTDNENATQIFANIRKTMLLLNDWFADPEIRNLLGILIHQNKNQKVEKLWKELRSFTTKSALVSKLKTECMALLPVEKDQDGRFKLQELNYEDTGHKEKLFNLFLLLDVAKLFPINGRSAVAYDFAKISAEQWSLEHIFPQNADDFKEVDSLGEEDLLVIREMLPALDEALLREDLREAGKAFYGQLMSQLRLPLEREDKKVLEHLLKTHSSSLHRFGNLALLSKPVNSSLSNHFFNEKRSRIVQKVSRGEFVPFHTYDVFSKLIIKTATGLHTWSKADIEAHENYITKQAKQIADYLTVN